MTDDTLTLHARGPAVVEQTHDPDGGPTVTEAHDTTLEAKFDVDADWLASEGDVYKQGAIIRRSDVADLVAETVSDDGRAVAPADVDEWELALTGRVSTYLDIAIAAARQRRSRATNAKTATTAAHILESLAEYAVDQRPLLGMYDLVQQYDVKDFSQADIRERLAGDDDVDVADGEEVTADV